jgi:Protein of unknown function (DUF998)
MVTKQNENLIISFLTLRRLIGILGMSLPVIVVVGGFLQNGFVIEPSISGYYYTNMRDFFVGILCGVALVLSSYRGYERIDRVVALTSGISAIGMVIFPTGVYSGKVIKVGMFLIDDNISAYIHLAFGALFFLSLSFISLFLFTRRHPGVMGKEKKRRNIIYRACGIVMIAVIFCITLYTMFLRDTSISKIDPVLIFESVGLLAFGISWLIKGNTLFKDKKT